MIKERKLPPLKDCIEIEVNGERTYKKIENEEINALIDENTLLKAQISALTENQTFLENCLIEVGQVIYA